ncbi:TetR/AcrR family transcriptional regulator [Acetobacterium tundrae]|uniref:TetR family transcriptional regulator n=1 Tax=Acetobacterium tundrae TaxID=132932 RepID=A0ABR6WIN9_9FIRM|nr:TetR/AcrR family transcriptional regulator [Acetobacterium tundrae]MBC3796153.1 TetR family transcriptional regulator [Acetobacterium tundrae]
MSVNKAKTNKQLIYDTAKNLFFTEGYQVGFRRIAQEIGISQGLITYHFKTKRNIAIEIYKEDYQILSTYLKYIVNPDEDIFLYIVSFYNLNSRINTANPEKLNFVKMTQSDNISCEAIYASSFKQIYLKLINHMQPNSYDQEKNLTLFLATTYSTFSAILQKQTESFDFSDEESLIHSVDLMYYCLGYDRNPKRTTDIIQKAKERVDSLFAKYPHLLDIHQYFIK